MSAGLGVAVMLVLERFTPGAVGEAARLLGLTITVGIDLLINGLLVGIGFAVDAKVGQLLALALAIEGLVLGLALTMQFTQIGFARGKASPRRSG